MGRGGILIFLFGALDLFAFYRSFPRLMRIFENYNASIYQVLVLIMIISLIASGALYMMGNKIGFVIYYFQFPMRVSFIPGLTFGFLTSILPVATGTLYYGMLLATIFALEAIRLMHTIQKHRSAG